MSKPNFAIASSELDEGSKKEAEVLLSKRDEILDKLVEAGLSADNERPYVYNVPTALSFECGHGKDLPIRSLWAIIVMARASYASANWLDTDAEGYPEIGFLGLERDFHAVRITDPFALHIDEAIKRHQVRLIQEGKARIVNGKFYTVA